MKTMITRNNVPRHNGTMRCLLGRNGPREFRAIAPRHGDLVRGMGRLVWGMGRFGPRLGAEMAGKAREVTVRYIPTQKLLLMTRLFSLVWRCSRWKQVLTGRQRPLWSVWSTILFWEDQKRARLTEGAMFYLEDGLLVSSQIWTSFELRCRHTTQHCPSFGPSDPWVTELWDGSLMQFMRRART